MWKEMLCAAAVVLGACADDLRDDSAGADAAAGSEERVVHTDNGDGTTTTVVDATDATAWIYLDVAARAEASPADPASSTEWDLGFQRFHIKLNGGVSGPGDVEVAVLPGADFDAMVDAPAGAYVTDAPDGDDDGTDVDLALSTGDAAWFDYDPATHVLSPRDQVYAVRLVSGDYIKLRVVDYYDDAGTGGHMSLRWGAIAPPAP